MNRGGGGRGRAGGGRGRGAWKGGAFAKGMPLRGDDHANEES
jgi:hypothetical protein